MTPRIKTVIRVGLWVTAALIGVVALVLDVVRWAVNINLPENLTAWVMLFVIILVYAGHQAGKSGPDVNHDLAAIQAEQRSLAAGQDDLRSLLGRVIARLDQIGPMVVETQRQAAGVAEAWRELARLVDAHRRNVPPRQKRPAGAEAQQEVEGEGVVDLEDFRMLKRIDEKIKERRPDD